MVTQTTSPSNAAPLSKLSNSTILIRPAHLYEATAIGRIAAETYYSTGLVAFLSPHRAQYYSHYERGFVQRAWKRMLDPRNLTFVAVSSSDLRTPVGYAQFVRLGDDEGAKRQAASRESLLLRIFGWVFWAYYLVLAWLVGKDKSADLEAVRAFEAEASGIDAEYWGVPERKNRWHTQSVVVKEEWQGKGIGKTLMAEVIARAEKENVVVGLEASEPGELMYRRVGFELLGRFKTTFGGENIVDAGGLMMWTPSKRKGFKI